MVGVGDLQLNFTPHALVNDALMAIFFFTVRLEVRRELAIGELTSWFRAMVPVAAAIAGLAMGRSSLRPQPGHPRERRLAVSLTGSMEPVLIAASRWRGS
jgi:hypothetical protein